MKQLVVAVMLAAAGASHQAAPVAESVFVGSTPCDQSIRAILGIPRDANADLIEWELTLEQAAAGRTNRAYHLRYRVGHTRPNQPGLDDTARRLEKRGTWRIGGNGQSQPARVVLELGGGMSFLKVSEAILHVLEPDRRLMRGNGGWSYTLVRRDDAEPPVDTRAASADPGDPPRTTSRETGPAVFGIFDGRTPCQGIARELGIPARPGCWKAKWRLTLFHDPTTHEPTNYRLEGTLYATRPREGRWRISRGTALNADADVFELAPSSGESPTQLLRGDDGVLFFLDRERQPLIGNASNAYTLDRRQF